MMISFETKLSYAKEEAYWLYKAYKEQYPISIFQETKNRFFIVINPPCS